MDRKGMGCVMAFNDRSVRICLEYNWTEHLAAFHWYWFDMMFDARSCFFCNDTGEYLHYGRGMWECVRE
jgi:hypothetical protein